MPASSVRGEVHVGLGTCGVGCTIAGAPLLPDCPAIDVLALPAAPASLPALPEEPEGRLTVPPHAKWRRPKDAKRDERKPRRRGLTNAEAKTGMSSRGAIRMPLRAPQTLGRSANPSASVG